jgi:hypothetical protein
MLMEKISLLVFGLSFVVSNCLFGQGSLTPPAGPIGPSMVTLSQIEPRVPISGVFSITEQGSYHLTTDIVVSSTNPVGIRIGARGVTLDLNGFTISSTANYNATSGAGAIELGSGLSDIVIRNGHIQGGITYSNGTYSQSGFGDGINCSGTAPVNARVTDVTVSGCADNGIYFGDVYEVNHATGNSTVVEGCTVSTVGGYGISAASVLRCSAYLCGNFAIDADVASDCYGYSDGAEGISAYQTANNCYGYSTGGTGLGASTAVNCYGVSSSGDGLDAQTAINCYGSTSGNSSDTGLDAVDAENCFGAATAGTGLNVTTALNCTGQSSGSPGTGLVASGTATGCYGYSTAKTNGVGISTTIAIGCYGICGAGNVGISAQIGNSSYSSSGDGKIQNKYNMP